MLLRSLISLFVVTILAAQSSCQYVDLFQGLQNFFQPYQFEVTTRRTVTRKHGSRQENINPAIVFPDDDRPRSTSRPRTTPKPRKSRPNSSHAPTTKRPSASKLQTQNPTNKQKNNRKIPELNLFNSDNIFFESDEKPIRRPNLNLNDDKPNRVTNGRNPDVTNAVTKNINQNIITNWGNGYTTRNPLLNRPGVKPAPVDESRPPITNRPVDIGFVYPETATNAASPADEPELVIGPDEDNMSSAEKRQYLEVAEEMCENYKALNVKKIVALPLVPSPQGVEFNVSDCTPINVPLIIGGTVSRIEEFPHMALVGWKMIQGNGYSWKCGGSLISDQYVLTAGHCTYQEKDYNVLSEEDAHTPRGISGPPHAVQLGSTYVNGPGAVVVKTSRVIRHPKYKQRRSYYDIALINLAKRVSFSDTIRPACLGVPPPVGQPIIATGWGRTEFGGDQSLELRSVSLPIWDMQDCRQIWGTSLKLPNGPSSDSQVCAGERAGGKDTCQGDSGGPAQMQDGCVWRVVAVTSSGRSCGAQDTPALYAKVPRVFVAAQVFGKRSLDNRYNNQNSFNQNNRNNQNNNRVNSNLNGQNSNNHQQNTRDSNVNSQSTWNSNQNSNFNQNNRNNENIYQQNTRDSTINNQNTWNTNQNINYNQNNRNNDNRDSTVNSQNTWYTNQNNRNVNNNQQNNNQNWNLNQNYNQQPNNQNNGNQNIYNSNDYNRNTYQSTNAYNQNQFNNRNGYVTESWNSNFNPVYDYNVGFGATERPWFR